MIALSAAFFFLYNWPWLLQRVSFYFKLGNETLIMSYVFLSKAVVIKQTKVGDISLKLQNIWNLGKQIAWRCIDMSLHSKIKNIID